ncbi:MAG: serine/threonine-protein kinase [Myxococcota bacterium]|nr:serine/threonine-protein kinase [Myxococcota bacterium]
MSEKAIKKCPKCDLMLPPGVLACPFCAAPKGTVRIWWDAQSQDAIVEASSMLARYTAPNSMIGALFDDRYRIKHVLGYGGMATVYLAEQQQPQRTVALKVFHSRYFEDQKIDEHFANEAIAASRLNHSHIVSVYEINQTKDGTRYMAMEFINGTRLDEEIETNEALPWLRACDITIQIGQALQYAHEHGVVHGDLKPANIILASYDEPQVAYAKLYDFGTSTIIDHGPLSNQLKDKSVKELIGTLEYMSPEQMKGTRLTPSTDVYSLGVILYQMITGGLPFEPKKPGLAMEIDGKRRTPPKKRSLDDLTSVPIDLKAIATSMISETPEDRPQNAGLVIEELKRIIRDYKPIDRQGLSWGDLSEPRKKKKAVRRIDKDNTTRIGVGYSPPSL